MFFKKKQKEMRVILTPTNNGVKIGFVLKKGKEEAPLTLPLNKEQIESFYRLLGFLEYISWENIYDSGNLEDGVLPFENYYNLLDSDEGYEVLKKLGMPVETLDVSGELRLNSIPNDADLSLHLRTSDGGNPDRVGTSFGAMYDMDGQLFLLPQKVYELKRAITEEYESGYQKIGICQQIAKEAEISLENFLENEQYNVIDSYDIDIQVHSPEHIEIIPTGNSSEETFSLNNPTQSVSSFKNGMKRSRYVRTGKISEDIKKLSTKRHIKGEEVPLFFENPSAVLPEHNYQLDLELFSDRVRGLIPIQHVRPVYNEGSGMEWFVSDSNSAVSYDTSLLRDLMEQHPNQQYVQHEGQWIYLDPTMRKKLLEIPEDEEAKLSKQFTLDIRDNESELEYKLSTDNALNFKPFSIPDTLHASLFDHQLEGFQWLCHLEQQSKGGLLADDMGLGKTIQVITFLLHQKEKGRLKPTLIVLPIALIENWIEEIKKFAPTLSESIYVHKGSNRLKVADQISQYNIILTSYDTLKIDQLVLGKVSFQSIICDEAQNVKSHSSQRSRALRAMQSDFRLAMTGTPVENSLEELWSIMDFVQPGDLGSLREFRQVYVEMNDFDGLLKAIKPYYLRRTKSEVLDDRLPKKYMKDPIYIEASGLQKEISQSMLQTKEIGQIAILNMLMKLRQLYGHPGVIIKDYETLPHERVPKVSELLKIIDRVQVKGEKVLIFTEFKRIHSILKRIFMQRYGVSVPVINGDTKNRQLAVQHFSNTPGFGIMLLSPKAAGVGLTITSANHVVHYTRWWNPAVENQATDRAYRIGQEKDVYVYQLITRDSQNFPQGTVEELMHELLESKRELAENVIVPFNTSEIQKTVVEKMEMDKDKLS